MDTETLQKLGYTQEDRDTLILRQYSDVQAFWNEEANPYPQMRFAAHLVRAIDAKAPGAAFQSVHLPLIKTALECARIMAPLIKGDKAKNNARTYLELSCTLVNEWIEKGCPMDEDSLARMRRHKARYRNDFQAEDTLMAFDIATEIRIAYSQPLITYYAVSKLSDLTSPWQTDTDAIRGILHEHLPDLQPAIMTARLMGVL